MGVGEDDGGWREDNDNAMRNFEDDLNDAIQLYVGIGTSQFPKEDDVKVIDQFGAEAAQPLVAGVRSVIDDLQKVQPDWERHTLVSASHWAVEQVSMNHPELTEKSKVALEWLYSWWWR